MECHEGSSTTDGPESIVIVSATLSERALTIVDELRQELERLNPGRVVRFACASCYTKEADHG